MCDVKSPEECVVAKCRSVMCVLRPSYIGRIQRPFYSKLSTVTNVKRRT